MHGIKSVEVHRVISEGSNEVKVPRSRKKPESVSKNFGEQLKNLDVLKVENNEDNTNSEFEMAKCISFTNWFLTFLIQDIPIIGEVALLFWACSKRNAVGKRQYAIARLIYKLIFDVIAIMIIFMLFKIASGALDALIVYMEAL